LSTQVFKQQSLQGCLLHSSNCKMTSHQPTVHISFKFTYNIHTHIACAAWLH